MITSIEPPLLKAAMAPPAESATFTAFGVGGLVGVQLRFEAVGRGDTSAGYTVRYDAAVGFTMVTFVLMAVALEGMVQLPLVPLTANGTDSPAPLAPLRVPTCSLPARVSARRHGAIDTYDDATDGEPAFAALITPAVVAAAAATAAVTMMLPQRNEAPFLDGPTGNLL